MLNPGEAEPEADDFESVLGALRDEFIASIRERGALVSSLAVELRRAETPAPVLLRLIREAHTMKGSAGTFGFPGVGEAAGEVERVARASHPSALFVDLDHAITRLSTTIRLMAEPHGAPSGNS